MNGHDFTREQNMEARIRLAAARRELADAVNDATTGIGCLTCDDPQTMNHIRACWKRIYDRYLETDSLIADLAACARNITDGGEWKPSELATESKPIDMAEGCACFTAETPDRVLITPSEPTPGENTAKRLANTLNALTGDVLLDATGIRLLDRADRHPGFLPLRPVVANATGALERAGRELWAITAHTLDRLPHRRFCVDLTMFADHPKILERFAVRYGKYLKDNRTALDVTIIDPTGLVARHVATIKPKWD